MNQTVRSEERSQRGLLGPVEIRALAEKLDVAPTKRLGQNFVHDTGTVRRIANQAGVGPGDSIIEVGPGLGSLTLALLEAGASVTAIEIDPRLALALADTVARFDPAWSQRLTVRNLDALNLQNDDVAGDPVALVANLPYNVSVPILLHVLQQFPSLSRVVVMVQKEVAERLAAPPGSRTYGVPSVKTAWYGNARMAGAVGRKVFWPEPNIDSALVLVDVAPSPPGDDQLREATFQLIDAAFGQRRKMIRSSLRGQLGSDAAATSLMEKAGLTGAERPEQLGIDAYIRLAKGLIDNAS